MNANGVLESEEINLLLPEPRQNSQPATVGVLRAAGEYRLIAVRPIAAGERLFRIEGERTTCPSRYSVQIGENVHIDLGSGKSTEEILDRYFWRFMNHSCDPTAQVHGQEVLALRNIEPFEAVTFDYNSTEWELAEPFLCRCGSPKCLGKIRGFRHLSPAQCEAVRPFLAPHLRPFATVARGTVESANV